MHRTMCFVAALSFSTLAFAGAPDVKGTWKSVAAEDQGNGTFATRTFTLTDKTWSLRYVTFADKDLKSPLLTVDFEGPWKATGESKRVPGAAEATFEFQKKRLTLHAKDAAKSLGMDGCGLTPGEPKDVSKSGCSFVASVEKYGREFDLLKRDGERLFFGARPADQDLGSEAKRPVTLGLPLEKK